MDIKKYAKILCGVLAGNAILAFTVSAFILPHGIIMGGATGMGITVNHYINIDLSVIVFGINIVLFIAGAFVFGKQFALTTIISTFTYPVFLSVARAVPGVDTLTDNILLATIYGGMLLGIGIGLVIRAGSSTGGSDILALILNKIFHTPVAVCVYIVDFLILGGQILFSDSEQILYGILTLITTSIVLNRVVLMGQSQIQLFVITNKYDEVKEKMLNEIEAGVTMVHIETGYHGKNQKGVLCVIPNRKLYAIKELIHTIDAEAFITITQINEVRGRGFTIDRNELGKNPKNTCI